MTEKKKKKKSHKKSKSVKSEQSEPVDEKSMDQSSARKKKKRTRKKKKKKNETENELAKSLLHEDEFDLEPPTLQVSKCNDIIFFALFLAVFGFFIYVAIVYGPAAVAKADASRTDPHDYTGYFYATATLAIVSFIASTVVMKFLMEFSSYVIKAFLFLALAVGLVMTQATSKTVNYSTYGYVIVVFVLFYAFTTWSRIPFATANIVTTLECLEDNFGIIYVGYVYVFILLTWTILWLLALDGTNEATKTCDNKGKNCQTNYLIFVPYTMVYLWVYQVIVNAVMATAAGLVTIWWTNPEEAADCVSNGVIKPTKRIAIFSFGSICYGSLLSPYIQGINDLINPDGDLSTGVTTYFPTKCVACFEAAVYRFTQWAFIYCGMYGYNFSKSGPRVMNLFEKKEWWPIASDNLIKNIFLLCNLSVGYVCLEFGLVLEANTDWFSDAKTSSSLYATVLGFAVGAIFSSTMLAIVVGAYLAVVVLFAENPEALEANHIDLYDDMKDAYRKSYPNVHIGSPYDNSVV